jgi:hypothetical protein
VITLYTGVTGGGKSAHAVEEILSWRRRPVIANIGIKRPRANWDLILAENVTPGNLIRIALQGHTCYQAVGEGRRECRCRGARWPLGVEGACLLVLDEVTALFQARNWDTEGRDEWLEFFNHHRKLGYEVILISQYDRAIDVQIRAVVDTEIAHHKARHALPFPFKQLAYVVPLPIFIRVTKSYQMKGKLAGSMSIHMLSWSAARRYDSFALFNSLDALASLGGDRAARRGAVGPGRVVQMRQGGGYWMRGGNRRDPQQPRVPDPASEIV